MGLTDNAADRRQQKRGAKAMRAEAEADLAALAGLMSMAEGRRAIRRLLEVTGCFSAAMPDEDTPHGFGFVVGMRQAGQNQLAMLHEAEPDLAAKIASEAAWRARGIERAAEAGREIDREAAGEGEA